MKAHKTDANHKDIVTTLRQVGALVLSLHKVGMGVPDILVGYRGRLWLIEIKTKTGKLNVLQRKFHSLWSGYTHVVRTPEEAIRLVSNG